MKVNTICWCCQEPLEVDETCYRPYTCTFCDKGTHLNTEIQGDEFECDIVCKCKMRRTIFVKRKAATELFKSRDNIKCRGCKSKEVVLHIKLWKGSSRNEVEGTAVIIAKEWKGKTPKELVEGA